VLTIGDGLYGDRKSNANVPERWPVFGNDAPNSLFFSRDPVAVDCVMVDILADAGAVYSNADDYMRLAADAGLGTYERGDRSTPGNPVYQVIDYVRMER
jgi:hypothetical protein